MFSFLETICIQDGKAQHLDFHQMRVNETFEQFFPEWEPFDVEELVAEQILPVEGTHRLRITYQEDPETIDILPMGADEIARCKPIYEVIPGWTETTVGVTDMDKLPATARYYLDRIAEVTGVPVHVVSTSPDRDHTILLHNPFAA